MYGIAEKRILKRVRAAKPDWIIAVKKGEYNHAAYIQM